MLRFAGCELDLEGRVLLNDGGPVHLEPQAFDLLAYLVRHRSRVIPREELLEAVFGGRWVSDSALSTRVKEVRRATGDSGQSQAVIRTVRGRGLQLAADVVETAELLHQRRPLIGRNRDLRGLDRRIARGSLVTIVGAGGVGKSALARAAALAASPQFEDVVIVDLTTLVDPAQLVGAIARVAQVSEAPGSDLVDVLRRREVVLLLDDADDLMPEVAAFCQSLRSTDSQVAVIVTSRERLGVDGEQLWPVLPLSASDAAELLLDRAAELAPLGGLDSAAPEEIAALAASVDNLPLALEMLAGMSAFLATDELSTLVERDLDQVTDGRRDIPARHRSTRHLVDTSIDRLDQRTWQALVALTGFAGAFRVTDAAEIVADDDGLWVVRQLIDRSLLSPVQTSEGLRFQMLRTVRHAATARATPTALQHAARRHAEFVASELGVADIAMRGPTEADAAAVFERLADEARAAHGWARFHDVDLAVRLTDALHLFAYTRLWTEPARWAQLIPGDAQEHGSVVATLASEASQQGDFDEATRLAQLIVDAVDARTRGWALEVMSDVEIYRGNLERAQDASQQLIGQGRQCGDLRMVAIGQTNAALSLIYAERALDALALLDATDSEQLRKFAPSEQAWLAFSRGEALAMLGDQGAIDPLTVAAELGDAVGNRFVAGIARSTVAGIQARSGDLTAAAASYADLLQTYAHHGNVTHLTVFLRNVLPILAALDEPAAVAVAGCWLFRPSDRTGPGPDVDAARQALAIVLSSHEPIQVQEWERQSRACSAADAAEVAVAALRRHVPSD